MKNYLNMKDLQYRLGHDKYAINNKTLWDVYQDNLKENNNIEYILFLEKYIPFYKNNTMKELDVIKF